MNIHEWFGTARWKTLLALFLLLAVSGLEARAEDAAPAPGADLKQGVGVGLGEVGTVGATYRLRLGPVGFEPGVGIYTYSVEAEDSGGTSYSKSGATVSFGANLVYFLSAPAEELQHGGLFAFSYQRVIGPVYTFGYRAEYPLGSGVGIHAGLGFSIAPEFDKKSEKFIEDETGAGNLDSDSTYVPLYVNVGLHF